MDKNTKITLDELMRRKEQMLAAKKKPATAELYIESLDGTITITEPSKAVITDATSMGEDTGEGDTYIVYKAVTDPPLEKLAAEYGCAEPTDIVDIVFKPGEVNGISKQALALAGYNDNSVSVVKTIKN